MLSILNFKINSIFSKYKQILIDKKNHLLNIFLKIISFINFIKIDVYRFNIFFVRKRKRNLKNFILYFQFIFSHKITFCRLIVSLVSEYFIC